MTTQTTISCPSCGQKTVSDSRSCASCQAAFPWSLQFERLEDQIKERESNRIRATATLVQEAFEAAKGGKPISLAAIKGFVASWIFPRAVVVLGSLLGVIVLVAQTYILWNQTRLLELQARAAQLEQVVKIRDRLASISGQIAALTRLREAYGKTLSQIDCTAETCKSTLVQKTLMDLREDNPVAPRSDSQQVWVSLGRQLSEMSSTAERLVRQPVVSIREGELPNNLAVVTDLLRPAASACLLEGAQAATLIERANAFTLLAANSHWVTQPAENMAQYVSFYKRFGQVKRNTDMGLIQFEGAAEDVSYLMSRMRGESRGRGSFRKEYTLYQLASDVRALHQATLSSLDSLLAACNKLASQDTAALAAINIRIEQR